MQRIIQGFWPQHGFSNTMHSDFDILVGRAWKVLSAQTGMHCDDPVRVLSAREAGKGNWRVVARGDITPPVILKFWTQGGAQKAQNAFRALVQAQTALHSYPDFTAPMPLAWDAQSGAVLMGVCEGQTLGECLGAQSGDILAEDLKPALQWVAALHAGSMVHDIPFAGLKKLHALGRSASAGQMPEPELFHACFAQLALLAAQAADLPNPAAFIHADLTSSNILVDGPAVAGIDINNVIRTSVAIDLAMLLCEVVTLYGQDMAAPAFSLVPPDWAAMCDAVYPALPVDSASFRFFAGVRLLRIWLQTPRRAKDRSLRRAHVWQGTRIAAIRLLLG